METFEKNYHSTYRIPNFVGFKNFEILQTEESDQKKVVDTPFSFWGHPQASKTQKPGSRDCSGGSVSV